eukprot:3705067-Pleurochrysis_carterae.AAC.1
MDADATAWERWIRTAATEQSAVEAATAMIASTAVAGTHTAAAKRATAPHARLPTARQFVALIAANAAVACVRAMPGSLITTLLALANVLALIALSLRG